MPRPRTFALLALASLASSAALAPSVQAQFPPIDYSISYEPLAANERCGTSFAPLADLDGDGECDVAVGCPGANGDSGRVAILDGATMTQLHEITLPGNPANAGFGSSLAFAGEPVGPGSVLLLVGAPGIGVGGTVYVRLVTATGSVDLGSVVYGEAGAGWGDQLVVGGDQNADGVPDYGAIAPLANFSGVDSGYLQMYDGATGNPLLFMFGNPLERLSRCVATIDVNEDGRDECIASFLGYPGGNGRGAVWAFSPTTFTFLPNPVLGANPGDQLGTGLADVGDVDCSGVSDLGIGIPGWDQGGLTDRGKVEVRSGTDFTSVLIEEVGVLEGDELGHDVTNCGDMDGDGFDDFCATAPGHEDPPGTPVNYAALFNGRTGETLSVAFSGPAIFSSGIKLPGFASPGDAIRRCYALDPEDSTVQPNGGSIAVAELAPEGVETFGAGADGCDGAHTIFVSDAPRIGSVDFRIHSARAPKLTVQLLLVADASSPGGTDPFGLGLDLFVDLLGATEVLAFDLPVSPCGLAEVQAPIPNEPLLVGKTYTTQSIFFWAGICLPTLYGLSSSGGMNLTIQPPS